MKGYRAPTTRVIHHPCFFPELRGFPGHGPFSAETRTLPNKLEWLVTLPLTTHNKIYLLNWDKGIPGEASKERPYRRPMKVSLKERLTYKHFKYLNKVSSWRTFPSPFSFLSLLAVAVNQKLAGKLWGEHQEGGKKAQGGDMENKPPTEKQPKQGSRKRFSAKSVLVSDYVRYSHYWI